MPFNIGDNVRLVSDPDGDLPPEVLGSVIEITDVDEEAKPVVYAFKYAPDGGPEKEYWVSADQLEDTSAQEEREAGASPDG